MSESKRHIQLKRKTVETSVMVDLNLDGYGYCQLETGIPFLDHLLFSFGRHGLFDLSMKVTSDSQVHHTVENVAVALGEAFRQALGLDVQGTRRIACEFMVQDESLARAVVDIGPLQCYSLADFRLGKEYIEGMPHELFEHFVRSFAIQAKMNIHVSVLYGTDDHHKAEAAFKALGRAIHYASQPDLKRPSMQEEYIDPQA